MGEVEESEVPETVDVAGYVGDEVVFEGEHLDVVALVEGRDAGEPIVAEVDVAQFGVVGGIEVGEAVVGEVDALDRGQQVGQEGADEVARDIQLLKTNQVHVAKEC